MSGSQETDHQRLARFAIAFRNLPRMQRDIFAAHRFEQCSFGKIAELTGLTVEEVGHQVARAMYKLMKQMEGETLTWRERWFSE